MLLKGALFIVFVPFVLSLVLSSQQDIGKEKGLLDLFLSPCKCKCGVPNREARLLGGEYLRGYEFPWLALIQIKGVTTIPGTLINDRYVITAASTLLGLTPYDVKITLGVFDRCAPDVSSTNVSVENVLLHPDFSPGNRANDLALLKLSNPVAVERRISPICLSTPGTKYLGQVATLVGWSTGPISDGELVSSCRPRKLGLPILDQTECLGSAFDPTAVSRDKGCAGIVGVPSVVCKTDAGGPVMYRSYDGIYQLVGVLTDRNHCNQKAGTALYTAINPHLSWITQNTRDACFCFKS